jgi:hypothetical protein
MKVTFECPEKWQLLWEYKEEYLGWLFANRVENDYNRTGNEIGINLVSTETQISGATY